MRILEWFLFYLCGILSAWMVSYETGKSIDTKIENARNLCQPTKEREIASLAYDKDGLSCAIIYKGNYLTRFKLEK